ncbi:MAG: hypothetical protein K5854_05975 [Prevotella sp.]|jgi:hypothetical protein|nr:hypothetical protein [Prevotella sp.]
MIYLVAAIIILGIIAATVGFISQKKYGETPIVKSEGDCSSCDGTSDKCEQVCMMEASTRDIEYYDDEELDRYKGRQADSYTDEEVEEFADVLYTLRKGEAEGWNRSLILRGINIPDRLKDELIMIIDEK